MSVAIGGLFNAKGYKFAYANQAAREAASGHTADDVGFQALQTDDGSLWTLVDHDPLTWASVATIESLGGITESDGDARYARRANNLSDLANAETARTNLGLGSAAVEAAAAFAAAIHTHATGDITGLAEFIRDTIGAAILEGANIDVTVDDAGDSITLAVTGIDAELVRDTIGAALAGGTGITVTNDDPGNTITVALNINGLTELSGAADPDTTFLAIYDPAITGTRKVKPANLGIAGGGGGGEYVAGIAAHLHKNGTDQTGIANETATKITFGTVTGPSAGLVASSTFTPGRQGEFAITGHVLGWRESGTPNNNTYAAVMLYKNGVYTQECRGMFVIASSGSFIVPVNFVAASDDNNDTFELYLWQNSGGSALVYGGTPVTHIAIAEVGQDSGASAGGGAGVTDTEWTALTLLNGATDDGGDTPTDDHRPVYRRIGDRVELRGRITKSGPDGSTAYASLPSGFRPLRRVLFPVASGGSLVVATVYANGELKFTGMPVWLDSISFSITADGEEPEGW